MTTQTTLDTMQNAMRLSDLSAMLLTCYEDEALRRHSYMIFGPSGVGKSQVVAQVAAALNLPMVDIRLSQMDAVDGRGVPSVKNGFTVWNPVKFFPDSDTGILFFDEVTSAPPSVQTLAYQAMLDRKIGETEIPEGWMVLAAGNLQSDRGITHTLAAPLINRMFVTTVTPHLDDWRIHAAMNDVDSRVIAFLGLRADLLHKFLPTEYVSGKQFPTPRGWFRVSDVVKRMGMLPEQIAHKMIVGSVGDEAGIAFIGFLQDSEGLVSLDMIFKNPENVPVPAETHKQYALAMGLATAMDKFTYDAGYKYLKRMNGDLQMLAATLAYHKNPEAFMRAAMFKEFAPALVRINKL